MYIEIEKNRSINADKIISVEIVSIDEAFHVNIDVGLPAKQTVLFKFPKEPVLRFQQDIRNNVEREYALKKFNAHPDVLLAFMKAKLLYMSITKNWQHKKDPVFIDVPFATMENGDVIVQNNEIFDYLFGTATPFYFFGEEESRIIKNIETEGNNKMRLTFN